MRPIFVLCFLLVPSFAPAASLVPSDPEPHMLGATVFDYDPIAQPSPAKSLRMTPHTPFVTKGDLGEMIHKIAGKGRTKPKKAKKGKPDLTALLPFDRTPARRPVLPPTASENSPVHQVPVSPVAAPFLAALFSLFALPLHKWERPTASYRRRLLANGFSRISRKAPC